MNNNKNDRGGTTKPRRPKAHSAKKANRPARPLPDVGDTVWYLRTAVLRQGTVLTTGMWCRGYKVTGVDTQQRTIDLAGLHDPLRGVPRERVIADDETAAALRAEAAELAAELAPYPQLAAQFATVPLGHHTASFVDPRRCTRCDLHAHHRAYANDGDAPVALPPADVWARVLPSLEALNLHRAKLPAQGLRGALAGCPRLAKLVLAKGRFGACDGGVAAVMAQIADAPAVGIDRPLDLDLREVRGLAVGDVARLAAGCPRLRALNVGQCGLEALPAELGACCRELEELKADQNRLTKLPASLCTLPKLRELNLGYNDWLEELPPAIAHMTLLDDGAPGERPRARLLQLRLDGSTRLARPPYRVCMAHKRGKRGRRAPDRGSFAAVRDWFAQQEEEQQAGGGGDPIAAAEAASAPPPPAAPSSAAAAADTDTGGGTPATSKATTTKTKKKAHTAKKANRPQPCATYTHLFT